MSINSSVLDESEIDSATGVILEALEAKQDDTVQDMIGKINDLITRLGAADSPATDLTPVSEHTSFATDVSAEESRGGGGGHRGRSRAVVPARRQRPTASGRKKKTPFELWNQKNQPPPKPQALKLTEAQRNATTERLLASKANKDLDGAQTFEALAVEEEESTGQPDTTRTKMQNDRLAGYVPIHKRYQDVIEKAQRKKAQIERQREDQELAPCTFKPNMGLSNRTFKPGQEFRQPVGTVYDRCNEYGQMKQFRANRRRHWQKKIEEKELTFEPRLNPNTRRILQKTAARNPSKTDLLLAVEERQRKFHVADDHTDAGHEEETFAPRINERSRRLARKGRVYDRLYKAARQSEESMMGKINTYFDETVNDNFDRPAVLKNKVRNGQGAVTNRERALQQQGVLVAPNEYNENVVQWDEGMGFLRATLRLP